MLATIKRSAQNSNVYRTYGILNSYQEFQRSRSNHLGFAVDKSPLGRLSSHVRLHTAAFSLHFPMHRMFPVQSYWHCASTIMH